MFMTNVSARLRALAWPASAAATFSSSTRCCLPRCHSRRPLTQNYPGFRNESAESRLVREHNLFNPFDFQASDPHRKAPPLQHVHTGTFAVGETATGDLERELLHLSTTRGPTPRTRNLIRHLITERRERPNAAHYEALIYENTQAEYGSADNVRRILKEMEHNGIQMSVNTCTAVLHVLAVHPDIDILEHILSTCQDMWVELDSEMLHLTCIIYLRAQMPEMALLHLEKIEASTPGEGEMSNKPQPLQGKVELWLYVLFINHLSMQNDWEGVMRMCYRLNDDMSLGIPLAMPQMDIPFKFWERLLNDAVFAQAKWVAIWIWRQWVLRKWIQPTRTTLKRFMAICANDGDVQLVEGCSTMIRHLPGPGTWRYPGSTLQSGARMYLRTAYQNADKKYLEAKKKKIDEDVTASRSPNSNTVKGDYKMTAPHWWYYKYIDGLQLPEGWGDSLQIDPWAALHKDHDVGSAWPSRLRALQDVADVKREFAAAREESTLKQRFADEKRELESIPDTDDSSAPKDQQPVEHREMKESWAKLDPDQTGRRDVANDEHYSESTPEPDIPAEHQSGQITDDQKTGESSVWDPVEEGHIEIFVPRIYLSGSKRLDLSGSSDAEISGSNADEQGAGESVQQVQLSTCSHGSAPQDEDVTALKSKQSNDKQKPEGYNSV